MCLFGCASNSFFILFLGMLLTSVQIGVHFSNIVSVCVIDVAVCAHIRLPTAMLQISEQLLLLVSQLVFRLIRAGNAAINFGFHVNCGSHRGVVVVFVVPEGFTCTPFCMNRKRRFLDIGQQNNGFVIGSLDAADKFDVIKLSLEVAKPLRLG